MISPRYPAHYFLQILFACGIQALQQKLSGFKLYTGAGIYHTGNKYLLKEMVNLYH